MKMMPSLSRADTYLNVESMATAQGTVAKKQLTRPFITISRQAGSGGSRVARMLAKALNAQGESETWRVFEENLTRRMLEANRMPAHFARFLPEDKVGEIPSSIGELIGLHPSLWELVQKTNLTIRKLAMVGNAIFVGRGANFVTNGIPGGLHVRLVASPEHRDRFLADLFNITVTEARRYNVRCDAARRRYVRTHFNADVEETTAYDLVINTGRVSLPEAVHLITDRVRKMQA